MKILLVVPWDEAIGGVSYVAGNLARYLHSRGHEVLFVFPGKSLFLNPKVTKFGFRGFELRMQAPLGERHPIISLSVFLLLFPITLFQLIRLVLRSRIDVINIHFPQQFCLYLAVCSRLLRAVLVTSIHGADVFRGGRLSNKNPWSLKLILRASKLIVAPSEQCRKYFAATFPDLAEKTRVIHNGVSLARFDNIPRRIDNGPYGRYVLSVSACNEQKALDVLVGAFKTVDEFFPSLNLVVVGDGPLRGELEALAMSLGLEPRIKFLGCQTPVEVVNLLYDCEIFVLPSRFETFGIAILEAMASKKPVIATTVGGIPEIIDNGKNGILVEPDNRPALAQAMLTLLNDQTLQRTMAERGRARVEKQFRWERTGKAYENAFCELVPQ